MAEFGKSSIGILELSRDNRVEETHYEYGNSPLFKHKKSSLPTFRLRSRNGREETDDLFSYLRFVESGNTG